MIWQDPSMLWLLWLIPLVAAAIWLNRWRQEKRLASFFDQRLINQLRRRYWEPGQRMRVVLLLTALFFFTVGLAGPSIGTEVREIEQRGLDMMVDRKSTRLNSSHVAISYAVFCLKKKNDNEQGVR